MVNYGKKWLAAILGHRNFPFQKTLGLYKKGFNFLKSIFLCAEIIIFENFFPVPNNKKNKSEKWLSKSMLVA